MADVEVAAGIFGVGIDAVAGKTESGAEVPVGAYLVERVGPGVAGYHRQPMKVARRQSGLQRVVIGTVDIAHLENLSEIGELGVERPPRLLTLAAGDFGRRVRIHLVNVAD